MLRKTILAIFVMATIAAIGIGDYHNVAKADSPPVSEISSITNGKAPKTQAILTLPPDKGRVSTVIDTPSGKAIMVLEGTIVANPKKSGTLTAQAAATTTYYRPCSTYIYGVGTSNVNIWKMKLSSTFWYNFQTVIRQSTPSVSTSAALPFSWSNIRAWNTYWNSQVRFADGQAVLKAGAFGLGFSVTYHLWIREDAWGNCNSGAYRG